jgi:hypothetical protein
MDSRAWISGARSPRDACIGCRSLSDRMTLSSEWWVASVLRSHRSSPINSDYFFLRCSSAPFLHPHHLACPGPASHNGFFLAIEHPRAPRCAFHSSAIRRLHWLPQLLHWKDPGPHLPPMLSEHSLIHQLQSLKETFAAKLPGEIEKIKKLRKCAPAAPRAPLRNADSKFQGARQQGCR